MYPCAYILFKCCFGPPTGLNQQRHAAQTYSMRRAHRSRHRTCSATNLGRRILINQINPEMPVRVVETLAPSQISGANSGPTPPPICTLLSVGQAFSGTQNVSNLQKEEAWRVNVRIQGCDLEHGYLCGTMEALNVPMADTPVVTFWEGEIVDTKNYTFYTGKWEATPEDDIRHWTKFPSFSHLRNQVEVDGGRSLDLSNYPYIFMRWKEQYFVNVGTDCGLTIAGFYYVCFSCSDGSINGFYYDPNSSPFQKLELKCTNEERSGFSFSSYELQ